MEILIIILAFLLYTAFVGFVAGIFFYCISILYSEEVNPDDDSFSS
ncbi:hypothetical protein JGH11_10950 [Dysgonomonas sp. Marseille-P4677]|nr:hypothetical protein [Dysgonomonas sp. Marseille-P4677]MBK5721391.1 hypothetical protein [Dysgonomonas sp. Marseille-P4677]